VGQRAHYSTPALAGLGDQAHKKLLTLFPTLHLSSTLGTVRLLGTQPKHSLCIRAPSIPRVAGSFEITCRHMDALAPVNALILLRLVALYDLCQACRTLHP